MDYASWGGGRKRAGMQVKRKPKSYLQEDMGKLDDLLPVLISCLIWWVFVDHIDDTRTGWNIEQLISDWHPRVDWSYQQPESLSCICINCHLPYDRCYGFEEQ
jgi:hypothetical protein